VYAESEPISRVDPYGQLEVKPMGQTAVPACGKPVEAKWDFFLEVHVNPNNPKSRVGAPCTGYIVQRVDVFCSINKCGKCNGDITFEEFTYYEAWPVRKGRRNSLLRKGGTATDTAISTPQKGTCGSYLQKGEIRFYCADGADDPTGNNAGTDDLSKLWKAGTYGNLRKTSSGLLPSTGIQPNFWSQPPVDGPARRGFTLDWECCPPTSSLTLLVTPRL